MKLFSNTLPLLFLLPAILVAQRDLKEIPDPDPEVERKSFQLGEGLEINLFASDPMIAKPIQMNWDARGRLWVVSSRRYPQIKPGEEANDQIIVLEDKNRDGTAESATVFADNLLIPTGVMPGDGGAYVANSTEMLFLRDTDGDGREDERKTILSGFGTEDTHHIIHTFKGGPDGMLYFNQSIYIHSHVETPWGVRRLLGGGIWHFRPETRQLEVFCKGFVNSWGHIFDRWGQSFCTDGAYGDGINYVFPGSVWVTSPDAKRILRGMNPGQPKHCSLEVVSGRHFPDDWSGTLVTNDFRGHRVNRFKIEENGSGYRSVQQPDLVATSHGGFRPIDARMGPDGCLYIADWYNPIIQHGEVDFRDPRRDHTHGRIWRVRFKDRPLVRQPDIVNASVNSLLENLRSQEDWTRHFTKRELRHRGSKSVLPTLEKWIQNLSPTDPDYEHLLVEATWVYQGANQCPLQMVEKLLAAKDHRARCMGLRAIYHWHAQLDGSFDRLSTATRDPHPRVRLEAVNGLRQLGTSAALAAAMQVLDSPMDENLDFALWTTCRHLEPKWMPEVARGNAPDLFKNNNQHLLFALRAARNPTLDPLLQGLENDKLGGNASETVQTIAGLADGSTMERLVEIASKSDNIEWLDLIAKEAASNKRGRPDTAEKLVMDLLGSTSEPRRQAGAKLSGAWKVTGAASALGDLLRGNTSDATKSAAASGLSGIGGNAVRAQFLQALESTDTGTASAGAVGLVRIDPKNCGAPIAKWLTSQNDPETVASVTDAILRRQDSAQSLANALVDKKLEPKVATALVRRVETSGAKTGNLREALMKSGGLEAMHQTLDEASMAKLIARIGSANRDRGEQIYRRENLQCQRCHAIAGAGGLIGPDLISVGASAPVDYIVESLLDPNKKIKEGYHMTMVSTESGENYAGSVVTETERRLQLRDANGKVANIEKDQIKKRDIVPISMMPAGLCASLRPDEFADLVLFLSELGKEGGLTISRKPLVRNWEAVTYTKASGEAIRRKGLNSFAQNGDAFPWKPVYSKVSGELPIVGLPEISGFQTRFSIVRFQLNVERAGRVQLAINDPAGLQIWLNLDQQSAENPELWLEKGVQTLTVAVDREKRTKALSVEFKEAGNQPAVVRPATR